MSQRSYKLRPLYGYHLEELVLGYRCILMKVRRLVSQKKYKIIREVPERRKDMALDCFCIMRVYTERTKKNLLCQMICPPQYSRGMFFLFFDVYRV